MYYAGAGWSIFFVWTAGGFITGMLFIGFAENIRLLQRIHDKLGSESVSNKEKRQPVQKMNDLRVSSRLVEDEKATIDSLYDHYPDELIVELVRSPKEDYCLVRFKSGHDYYVRVVYAGGFGVQETDDPAIRQSIIEWYNEKTHDSRSGVSGTSTCTAETS
ncbi:hypothetical protein [Lentibacillus salinarum]|uniref:hypothetical protein n=1 Tax=Lentibacillus salinarum TaxID=446820 RepID=UPI0036D3FB71